MHTATVYNRFGDFIVVDLESLDNGTGVRLYYNEKLQKYFPIKTEIQKQALKSFLEKAFLDEEVEQILDLLS